MVKLSMTALPDPHASASGLNTTATTPSGNNQQSRYSTPPGGQESNFHSLLQFEDHGQVARAAHEHPMVALPRPGERIWRPPFRTTPLKQGMWAELEPGRPNLLVLGDLRVTAKPPDKLDRKARAGATRRRQNLRLTPDSARRGLEHHPDLGHLVVRPLERRGHGRVGHVRGRGDAIGAIGCVKAGDLAEDVVHVAAPA